MGWIGWQGVPSSRIPPRSGLVVLLAPGDYANLEIEAGDWLKESMRPGALQVLPEAVQLQRPVLCVYGTDEAGKTICPQLKGANVRILSVPGGHHFNRDYAPIEDAILEGVM